MKQLYEKFSIEHRLKCNTLVDLLSSLASHQPNKIAYIFLEDGEAKEVSLTYQELDRQARAIATQLLSVTTSGSTALLLYPSGLEFIAAFFGCLYAGVIAVPAYPPRRNQNMSRLEAIITDSQATVALTTKDILVNIKSRLAENSELINLEWLATDTIAVEGTENLVDIAPISGDTIAFLQYTSGSTGTPKGVIVSHRNLLYNEQMLKVAFENTEKTIGVSWLPLFHDMGLIGNVVQPLYLGITCILMSPVAFLQKPFRWLQAISRYRGTTSGGPNFAYDLCVRKITPEQKSTLDLSSWELAFSGAEPVRAETLENFTNSFASCGFRREVFYPCYGMAEATLFVSGGLKSAAPLVCSVESKSLEQNQIVAVSDSNISQKEVKNIVSCGQGCLNEEIVIVDPECLTQCPAGKVGEIWISGTNVALGYWHRPIETEETFNAYLADTNKGPFLRTGDLGFCIDGELFVTGRLKDVIIIRGRNHYPQDIELTVERSHPALRSNSGAAFSLDIDGKEELVIVQEIERTYLHTMNVKEIVGNIRQAVGEEHELQTYAIFLLKTGSIPKTSSGKIQHYASKTGFINGSLNVVGKWSKNPQKLEAYLLCQ